jgi:beta-alanine degradation protein BauB
MSVMKSVFVGVAGALAVTVAIAAESSSLPVTKLKFFETGIGPLKAAAAFGDLQKGAHGTYIKMPAGFVTPPHLHSEDYYGVVISGVGANGVPGAPDVELPVGSYWFQKGKEVHVTKCVSANECIFFLSQPGKFDFVAK